MAADEIRTIASLIAYISKIKNLFFYLSAFFLRIYYRIVGMVPKKVYCIRISCSFHIIHLFVK